MKITIISSDNRYKYLNEMLKSKGFFSEILDLPQGTEDFLILPVKREHNEDELKKIFEKIGANTTVLSPYTINQKTINNYAENESFLKENAYLTAEGAIYLYYSAIKETLFDKNVVVFGYGRIGKYLSKMLKNQGANVYVYARRKEVQTEIKLDGYSNIFIDNILSITPSVIFNTIPNLINNTIYDAPIIELASGKNNFTKENFIINGAGLPGKLFPKTAAEIILKTILPMMTF